MYKLKLLKQILNNLTNERKIKDIHDISITEARCVENLTSIPLSLEFKKPLANGRCIRMRRNINLDGDEIVIGFKKLWNNDYPFEFRYYFLVFKDEQRLLLLYDLIGEGDSFFTTEVENTLEMEMWYKGYLRELNKGVN